MSETLPAMIGMAIGIMGAHGQACVEQENTPISPRRKQTTTVGRRYEVGVVDGEGLVHVLEGWRGDSRWPNGEGEAMSLAVVVVWVLANDYNLDFMERRVTRPMRR